MTTEQLKLFDEIEETAFQQDFKFGVKFCTHCKKELPVKSFHLWSASAFGGQMRRTACIKCTSKHKKIIDNLKLTSPPQTDFCQCCGMTVEQLKKRGNSKNYGSIQLDHDHHTHEFRGWICYTCNQGIGKLQDNLEGVLIAALYLSKNNVDLILEKIKKIKHETDG
jgi:hypothetical protein